MTKSDNKKDLTSDWEKLTIEEQDKFIEHARYLIERRYVEAIDVEELAKKIFRNKFKQ